MEENILDVLEKRVYQALKKIAEQQTTINTLNREKKEIENNLFEKDKEIARLQKSLQEAETQQDDTIIAEYQAREEQLKERIQDLITKIDQVRLLE